MAHYAKIGLNSKVMSVIVVANTDCQNADGIEEEEVGRQFLENAFGWPLWKKCSYNTQGNVHKEGGTPYRKNYPSIGSNGMKIVMLFMDLNLIILGF
jgi:hypothetical protein